MQNADVENKIIKYLWEKQPLRILLLFVVSISIIQSINLTFEPIITKAHKYYRYYFGIIPPRSETRIFRHAFYSGESLEKISDEFTVSDEISPDDSAMFNRIILNTEALKFNGREKIEQIFKNYKSKEERKLLYHALISQYEGYLIGRDDLTYEFKKVGYYLSWLAELIEKTPINSGSLKFALTELSGSWEIIRTRVDFKIIEVNLLPDKFDGLEVISMRQSLIVARQILDKYIGSDDMLANKKHNKNINSFAFAHWDAPYVAPIM